MSSEKIGRLLLGFSEKPGSNRVFLRCYGITLCITVARFNHDRREITLTHTDTKVSGAKVVVLGSGYENAVCTVSFPCRNGGEVSGKIQVAPTQRGRDQIRLIFEFPKAVGIQREQCKKKKACKRGRDRRKTNAYVSA